jgi:hypothetical protein
MAFAQGCDFRASLAYVTDGATDHFFNGFTGSPYPITTAQGNTAGWESVTGSTISSANRSTTVDHRLAGIVYAPNDGSSSGTFRIDLPAPGSYNIRMACGDASNEQRCSLELFDDTTSLGVLLDRADTVAAGRFWDATGVLRTSAANWVANNAPLTVTFASSICRFKLGGLATSLVNPIAYFYIESAGGGAQTIPLTLSASNSTAAAIARQAALARVASISATAARQASALAFHAIGQAQLASRRAQMVTARALSSASSASRSRSVSVTHAAAQSPAAAVDRAAARALASAAVLQASLRREVDTSRAVSTGSAASLSAIKAKVLTLAATAAQSAFIRRSVGYMRAVAQNAAAGRILAVATARSVASGTAATIARGSSALSLTLTASVGSVAAGLGVHVAAARQAMQSTAAGIGRAVTATRRATAAQVARIAKGLPPRVLSAVSTALASITALATSNLIPDALYRVPSLARSFVVKSLSRLFKV